MSTRKRLNLSSNDSGIGASPSTPIKSDTSLNTSSATSNTYTPKRKSTGSHKASVERKRKARRHNLKRLSK